MKPARPGCGFATWWVEVHLLHQAVEGRIQGLAQAIQQFELQAVAPRLPAPQPQRHVLIHQKPITIDGDPQAPAAIAVPQVLQRGVDQDPVQQQRLVGTQVGRTHRQQLGTARLGQTQRVGQQPVHGDLPQRSRALDRFTPGPRRVNREPMAAWGERWLVNHKAETGCPVALAALKWGRSGQPLGRQIIQLNHNVGTQAQLAGIGEGPVAHLELQLPGAIGQQRAVAGALDLHLGQPVRQGALQLLHRFWRRHLLQAPRRRARLQGGISRGGAAPLSPSGQVPRLGGLQHAGQQPVEPGWQQRCQGEHHHQQRWQGQGKQTSQRSEERHQARGRPIQSFHCAASGPCPCLRGPCFDARSGSLLLICAKCCSVVINQRS